MVVLKYILLLFSILLFVSCSSRKQTNDYSLQLADNITHNQQTNQQHKIRTTDEQFEQLARNTNIEEQTRLFIFDIEGKLRAIQDTRRTTGRNELESGTRRNVTETEGRRTDTLHTRFTRNINTAKKDTTQKDYRPLQGTELLYMVPVFIILGIYLIRRFKKNENQLPQYRRNRQTLPNLQDPSR